MSFQLFRLLYTIEKNAISEKGIMKDTEERNLVLMYDIFPAFTRKY